MYLLRYNLILIVFIFFVACQIDLPKDVKTALQNVPDEIDFNLHVKPILSDKCYACHGPDLTNQKAGLSLHKAEFAFAKLDNSGKEAIVPGKLKNSELIYRILSEEDDLMMPPIESNLTLTPSEKAILVKWIENGAEYKKHWALIPPQKHEVPVLKNNAQAMNEIDHFVQEQLERHNLQLQPEADKETLIRRVSFDLTGLPPTIDEIDDFLQDTDANAYEKVVDRLLASPHYGEKLAVDWLDLARYADTHGYQIDRYRPMWPWRDWVINSFNENMPFDQFVTWQLAGDLLPNPSKEQKLATAFNRNHSQNAEGGIVNEEFRIEYVADRTNTFGKAFLSLSLECSRCHDHKFDPISQKEYFELFSFFNNIDEAGQISWDDAMPVPTMLLTDSGKDSIIHFLETSINNKEKEIEQIAASQELVQQSTPKISTTLQKGLIAHFNFDKVYNHQFSNLLNKFEKAMIVETQPWKNKALAPTLVNGKFGKALQFNGDDPLTLNGLGVFSRADPFTIGFWVNIPQGLKEGVFFHKGNGALLYSYRGFHLALRNNQLEVLMAHTWPYNNIVKVSDSTLVIPKDKWIHLSVSYDGSSKAKGLKVYLNGEEVGMLVEKDNLYKDILFHDKENLYQTTQESGLEFGARWRAVGLKNAMIDDIKVYNRELSSAELVYLSNSNREIKEEEKRRWLAHHTNKNFKEALKELQELRREQNSFMEDVPEIMVMEEMPKPRETHILERGAYDAPGDVVYPNTPESVLSFPEDLPKNRLGLARWLFSEENPLTARVFVNRYWQNFFGQGIVKSSDDFGNQGHLPSHLPLLDWLAIQFKASGWDIKTMHKLIAMSATYKQSSTTSPELKEKDYDNTLLSRGPSARLSAEMIRDNALRSSDLLNTEIGGESVKPYQPKGLWLISGKAKYNQSSGEDLYRRSLYTIWKRTLPPPSMNTFDAPDRSYCIVKREKTSTPLQSLVLLNDPQFVEASRALASKAMQSQETLETRITHIFRSLTSHFPTDKELKVLLKFYQKQSLDFEGQQSKMEGWLNEGEFEAPLDLPKNELATFTVLASMIMNTDGSIVKR